MRKGMQFAAVVVVATALGVSAALPRVAVGAVDGVRTQWVRPVDGPVVDPFRPPANPYGPGHRGVTLAADPGTDVRAAGSGVVAYAGLIAGVSWVSLDHPGGLRTTYGGLDAVAVVAGQPVGVGQRIAVVGPGGRIHFGLRRGDAYLDPLRLFRPRVRLVAPR